MILKYSLKIFIIMEQIFFETQDAWFMAAYSYGKETKIKAHKKDLVINGLLHLGYEFNNEIHFLISADNVLGEKRIKYI